MSKSIWCRFSRLPAVVLGGALLSGCGGEETIPLKKPDFLMEAPKEDSELKKTKPLPGLSAGMKPEQRPGKLKQ